MAAAGCSGNAAFTGADRHDLELCACGEDVTREADGRRSQHKLARIVYPRDPNSPT